MGYVGFPLTAAISNAKKYEVTGIDNNQEKIDAINEGNPITAKKILSYEF